MIMKFPINIVLDIQELYERESKQELSEFVLKIHAQISRTHLVKMNR